MVIVAFVVAALVTVLLASGTIQLIAAACLGFSIAFAIVGWIIGGEVHSLRFLWGAIGEEATAEALSALDDSWWVEHDIPWRYGNFDHIVIGPPGVFLLDSKHLFSKASVTQDALRSGTLRYRGAGFRGQARALGEMLAAESDSRPWVQAVAVVWGELGHDTREENRVIYLEGRNLVTWLRSCPTRLSPQRRDELVRAAQGVQERLSSESREREDR